MFDGIELMDGRELENALQSTWVIGQGKPDLACLIHRQSRLLEFSPRKKLVYLSVKVKLDHTYPNRTDVALVANANLGWLRSLFRSVLFS